MHILRSDISCYYIGSPERWEEKKDSTERVREEKLFHTRMQPKIKIPNKPHNNPTNSKTNSKVPKTSNPKHMASEGEQEREREEQVNLMCFAYMLLVVWREDGGKYIKASRRRASHQTWTCHAECVLKQTTGWAPFGHGRWKVREREKVREAGGEKEEGGKWGKVGRKRTTPATLPIRAVATTKGWEKKSLHHHGLEALQWFWSRNLQSF